MSPAIEPVRAVTIVDVANHAGVSRTTASDALRGNSKVSARTRERVVEAARAIGYRVNTAARSLRTAETGTLGLLAPARMTGIDYYMQVAFGVLEACADEGYDVTMITSSRYADGSTLPRVDGVIIPDPLVDDAAARALLSSPLPKLTLEHVPNLDVKVAVLAADHESRARELLHHLVERGGTHPGMLASSAVTDWGIRLQRLYREWAVEFGVEPLLVDRPFGSLATDWRGAAEGLLDAGVDAILCGSIAAVNAACDVIEKRGQQVGTDVLVASLVDAPELRERTVPVTAVDLRPRDAGAESVRVLLDVIRGRIAPDATVPFAIDVQYRASTRGSASR